MSVRRRLPGMLGVAGALTIAACASNAAAAHRPAQAAAAAGARPATRAAVAGGGWLTFGYDPQRSGVGPASTGITAANVKRLRRVTVSLDGTVDAAAIELHAVRAAGRRRDVIVITTDYGRTEALDARSGRRLWEFAPRSVASLQGSSQVTTATPVADPDRRYVYAASPDGVVHKLRVSDGRQLWSRRVSFDPTREKLDGALNFADGSLIVATGGYYGDAPVYQGHVVLIDPRSGRITRVWNALCSNVHALLDPPRRCGASDAAIWGRGGSIVEPDGNILVATGNGPFNGSTNWGDSVLELSPRLGLLHSWTPSNQQQLNVDDTDLGSTEPALLPARGGLRLAIQGGKDGILRLLSLGALGAGGAVLQQLPSPAGAEVLTQPAVWTSAGRTLVFVTDDAGTAAYRFAADSRLHLVWSDGSAGTSPVIAGGLLYVFDPDAGTLDVRNPASGHLLTALPAAAGHWNSPIVAGGRVILPVGNYHDQSSTGKLFIYELPG